MSDEQDGRRSQRPCSRAPRRRAIPAGRGAGDRVEGAERLVEQQSAGFSVEHGAREGDALAHPAGKAPPGRARLKACEAEAREQRSRRPAARACRASACRRRFRSARAALSMALRPRAAAGRAEPCSAQRPEPFVLPGVSAALDPRPRPAARRRGVPAAELEQRVVLPQPDGPTIADDLARRRARGRCRSITSVRSPKSAARRPTSTTGSPLSRGARSRTALPSSPQSGEPFVRRHVTGVTAPFARITAQVLRVGAGRSIPKAQSQPACLRAPLDRSAPV